MKSSAVLSFKCVIKLFYYRFFFFPVILKTYSHIGVIKYYTVYVIARKTEIKWIFAYHRWKWGDSLANYQTETVIVNQTK